MQPQSTWWLYMIRCADNSLYTGITIDIDRRFAEHQSQGKKSAKYLRGKGPLELVFTTPVGTKSEASQLEVRVKGCSKRVKERIVAGLVDVLGWVDLAD
jgi:putative endonuclease